MYSVNLPKYAGGKWILIFDSGSPKGALHIFENESSIHKFEGTLHYELLKIIQAYGSEGRHYTWWSIK